METGCIKQPPPERPAEEISQEIPANCPDGLVCYTDEDDAKLARGFLALQKLETWARITWIACRPTDPETP